MIAVLLRLGSSLERAIFQCWWIWLLGLSVGSIGAEQTAAPMDGAEFYRQRIKPLLAENCIRCHGPTRSRSGLRLDSREMVLHGGHGPIVVLGDPAHSRLIDAVSYEDEDVQMPPSGKLSEGEINDLTRWVQLGIPWSDEGTDHPATSARVTAAAVTAMSKVPKPPGAAPPPTPASRSRQLMRLGRLHPLVIHFPIALLLSACLAEALVMVQSWLGRSDQSERMATVASFCLVLAVVSSVVSSVLGWWFAWSMESEALSPYLVWHRWMGVSTSALAALALACSWWNRRSNPPRGCGIAWYRLFLFLSGIAVAITGHLGGKMVYG